MVLRLLSVKFYEGSNVAECPSFKIELFILTVHDLSICYVISHINEEGESSSDESDVIVLGHFQKQHKCHIFLHLKSDLH